MPEMNNDELDRALDAALAKYTAVEPQTGLEQRLLAHLRADQGRVPHRGWWAWSAAVVLVTVVVVSLSLAWKSKSHSIAGKHPGVSRPTEAGQVSRTTNAPPTKKEVKRRSSPRPLHSENRVAAGNPKLDQFPSAQPLSAEEIALAQYVKTFPKEAQLVAQAQEEFEIEIQKEINDAGSETHSGSIQQER